MNTDLQNSDLLARYLQAIGQYLPPESRADVLAELRTELLDQMDARAEEWGRPLDVADIAAILKAHGKPEAVALRYLPQRSLIGPTIFPFYLLTLRRVLPLVVGVYVIGKAATLFFSQSAHTPAAVASSIVRGLVGLIPALFIFWGTVTIVFACIDYARNNPAVKAGLEQWDPLKLPALESQAPRQKSFTVRVVELVVHCIWMLYVFAIPRHPFLIIGPASWGMEAAGVAFGPAWRPFYMLLIVLLSVQLLMRLLALRPGEHPALKPLDILTHLLGIAALSLLAFSKQIIVAANPLVDAQKLAGVNHAIGLALRIALFVAAVGVVLDAWKFLRSRVGVLQRLTV
jgi:hypothetical protein